MYLVPGIQNVLSLSFAAVAIAWYCRGMLHSNMLRNTAHVALDFSPDPVNCAARMSGQSPLLLLISAVYRTRIDLPTHKKTNQFHDVDI